MSAVASAVAAVAAAVATGISWKAMQTATRDARVRYAVDLWLEYERRTNDLFSSGTPTQLLEAQTFDDKVAVTPVQVAFLRWVSHVESVALAVEHDAAWMPVLRQGLHSQAHAVDAVVPFIEGYRKGHKDPTAFIRAERFLKQIRSQTLPP